MKAGILLVANYSNKTGYAWNNIYRLFNKIGDEFKELDVPVHVSFAEIEHPVDNFNSEFTVHQYDPSDTSVANTIKFLRLIAGNNIRNIYFTDQKAFDYRYPLLRLFKVRKIVVHNRISVSDPYPAKYEGGLSGVIKAMVGKSDFLCADRIYAVSDFVKDRLLLKNRLPDRRVVKILNGIDLERFSPNNFNYDNTNSAITIFVGGRATKHKGIHILIQAAGKLKINSATPFVIRYAGDGPDMDYFRELVKENALQDNFLFLGEVRSARDEISRADIIVVPSIWGDACPSAVSEALASGKPLIATSVGGVPEIIGDKGNAVIVPPADAGSMYQALEGLIESSAMRLQYGKKGRERASAALDQNIYYAKVIEQLKRDFLFL